MELAYGYQVRGRYQAVPSRKEDDFDAALAALDEALRIATRSRASTAPFIWKQIDEIDRLRDTAGLEEKEAAFQEAVSAAPVRFVGKTAQIGGQAVSVHDLPELLAQIPKAERGLFFREDRETIAVTLAPEISLPAGMRAFDQIGISAFPAGVERIPLELSMGPVLFTLIEKQAGRADAIFFSSDKVFRYAVTSWLPEANRPLDRRPAVVVADRGQTEDKPAAFIVGLVRAADAHPDRILLVEYFTVVQYRGRQLLLISA